MLDPATDHLIQMFPEGFWYDITMFLGGLTLAEGALIAVASGVEMTVTRRAEKQALVPSQQAVQ